MAGMDLHSQEAMGDTIGHIKVIEDSQFILYTYDGQLYNMITIQHFKFKWVSEPGLAMYPGSKMDCIESLILKVYIF